MYQVELYIIEFFVWYNVANDHVYKYNVIQINNHFNFIIILNNTTNC